jgi:type IV secretion system protein VirB8
MTEDGALSGFDVDLITGPQRSARIAWRVASCAVVVALLLAGVIMALMPLRRTEVFTILVDSTTGSAERIYQVQPTGISDQEAVKEALLVAYIADRESYFTPGLQDRLEGVQRRSAGAARDSLQVLWTAGGPDYPPALYGPNAQVDVLVRSISFLQPLVAQIRFEKRLARPNQAPVTRAFIATVSFAFEPRQERSLERVWENPLGFTVSAYRVDAETVDALTAEGVN